MPGRAATAAAAGTTGGRRWGASWGAEAEDKMTNDQSPMTSECPMTNDGSNTLVRASARHRALGIGHSLGDWVLGIVHFLVIGYLVIGHSLVIGIWSLVIPSVNRIGSLEITLTGS